MIGQQRLRDRPRRLRSAALSSRLREGLEVGSFPRHGLPGAPSDLASLGHPPAPPGALERDDAEPGGEKRSRRLRAAGGDPSWSVKSPCA